MDMHDWIIENGYKDIMIIFGLVHDSILAEVKEEHIDLYSSKLKEFTEKPRGKVFIENTPISTDLEVGDDYGSVSEYEFSKTA
jgi:DNA polymerase I-like protein with 3'-5' exonuclease and polymerase domains